MADALAHTFRRASQRPSPYHTNLLVVAEQVEIWFSKIERDVIALGVFTSVKDLARKLGRSMPTQLTPSPSSGDTPIPRVATATGPA